MNAEDGPAVCSSCLGSSPNLNISKEHNAEECKFCTRPFTVYKWAPEKAGSMKKTIICLTCARQRNCCQSCLLDLTYRIPLQVRDAALRMAGINGLTEIDQPKNQMSKLYIANNEAKFKNLGGAAITANSEKAKEILTKLAAVTNGKAQPKRPKEHINTPKHLDKVDVTKIVAKLPLNGSLDPPRNLSLKTLFIFGLDESLPEYKISDYFEQFGTIKSFKCQHSSRCGFITFQSRKDAEDAAKSISTPKENSPGLLVIENIPLRVTWGKERPLGSNSVEKLKIGSIVTKILKKFSGSTTTETLGRTGIKPRTAKDDKPITYESTRPDYEG